MILFLSGAGSILNGPMGIVVYLIFFMAIMYFLMIRPQKKEEKKKKEMLNSIAVGDGVLTTAGFYGEIIDMTADMVIVEFGSNKNCRIPMQKASIVSVEKPKYKAEEKNTESK